MSSTKKPNSTANKKQKIIQEEQVDEDQVVPTPAGAAGAAELQQETDIPMVEVVDKLTEKRLKSSWTETVDRKSKYRRTKGELIREMERERQVLFAALPAGCLRQIAKLTGDPSISGETIDSCREIGGILIEKGVTAAIETAVASGKKTITAANVAENMRTIAHIVVLGLLDENGKYKDPRAAKALAKKRKAAKEAKEAGKLASDEAAPEQAAEEQQQQQQQNDDEGQTETAQESSTLLAV